MPAITTLPATAERWDDVQHALSGGGDGRSCQCAWFTLTNAEFDHTSVDERRDLLHGEVQADPPPGLVAYVDGEAAGWVRAGPRTIQRRIARTRAIITSTPQPLDDDSVWAITCFVARKEHRGLGLNAALLRAAVDLARDHGARVIEAYPVDTSIGHVPPNDLYHGALSTFLAAGFTETAVTKPGRPLVALEL
ncbi:GNAT family N-acetyltransferase [Microbacterium sp. M28]|uniref:GNAT family N-acetyltransferase n=1 Tax=Microbacterium sp. M28 TaxID=2962064 RepID=UPI0021F46669|nr:GNAT family N-acetyltransferase [Microbacterium sp. M28]UYO95971.1 GNAT family N-acetyltransferase [Microbacterium sp. M28]